MGNSSMDILAISLVNGYAMAAMVQCGDGHVPAPGGKTTNDRREEPLASKAISDEHRSGPAQAHTMMPWGCAGPPGWGTPLVPPVLLVVEEVKDVSLGWFLYHTHCVRVRNRHVQYYRRRACSAAFLMQLSTRAPCNGDNPIIFLR